MAGPELQRRIGRVARGLLQAEAVDRGAEDPRLGVGRVGLGVAVGGLAVMAGDRGVDDAGVESGGGEGALHRAMIRAGLLDGDDRVAEIMLGDGPLEVVDGGVASRAGVLDDGQGDEDAAVEGGEPPGGAGLGRVDGDDAEVLGSDGLDARGEQAVGSAEVLAPVGAAAAGSRAGLQGWVLRERPRVYLPPAWRPTGGRRREEFFSLSKNFARYQRATLRQAMLGEALTSPASPHPLVAKAQRSDGNGLAVMGQLRPAGYPMRASPTIGLASGS